MLIILQARLQQYLNCELPDVQAGCRKGRRTRDQIDNICWIIKKARELQKTIYSPRELDYKESWVLKNWCFRTVVLEKTLKSSLDFKEIQPVNPKENQSWISTGRTEVEAETPIIWPPNARNWIIGKDLDAGKELGQEKGMTEEEMVVWHYRLDGCESE